MSTYTKVKVSRQGEIAIVTLNDPSSLNAASVELGEQLMAALREAAVGANPARAIVMTGEGRGFCSGANLSGGMEGRLEDGDGKVDAGAFLDKVYNPLVTVIRDLPIPIVTAVNGAAAGVGCSLALAGDIIVAGESAFFLQAFRRIGLVPDGGSTFMLPRMIGRARAMEMVLMGERVPAKTALEWGLVNRCVPDAELMPTALKFAEELSKGPASLGLIRGLMWDSLDNSWIEQLRAEREAQRIAGKSDDFREGIEAFNEKRPAVFTGR